MVHQVSLFVLYRLNLPVRYYQVTPQQLLKAPEPASCLGVIKHTRMRAVVEPV